MRYLLLVIALREDGQEVWLPFWFTCDSHDEALIKSKTIAFNYYENSNCPPNSFRFELFKTDSILPVTYSSTWAEEFLSKKI